VVSDGMYIEVMLAKGCCVDGMREGKMEGFNPYLYAVHGC
jgi:hypothetical protein